MAITVRPSNTITVDRAELHPDPAADEPGRHRVVPLPDRDPGVPVDPRGQRQPGREHLDRQRAQRFLARTPVCPTVRVRFAIRRWSSWRPRPRAARSARSMDSTSGIGTSGCGGTGRLRPRRRPSRGRLPARGGSRTRRTRSANGTTPTGGDSSRPRPNSTRDTADLRLSYRILSIGTPPSSVNACTCPSRNASCPWVANTRCTDFPGKRQPQREQETLRLTPADRPTDPRNRPQPPRPARGSAGRTPAPGRGRPRRRSPAGAWRRSPAPSSTTPPSRRARRPTGPTPAPRCAAASSGASRSVRNIRRSSALNGSNLRDTRTGVFRGGGTALANACRTVLRCTRCRSASARIDRSSTRASRRITANNSTLDPIPAPSPDEHRTCRVHRRGGARSNRHNAPGVSKVGQVAKATLGSGERAASVQRRGRCVSSSHVLWRFPAARRGAVRSRRCAGPDTTTKERDGTQRVRSDQRPRSRSHRARPTAVRGPSRPRRNSTVAPHPAPVGAA